FASDRRSQLLVARLQVCYGWSLVLLGDFDSARIITLESLDKLRAANLKMDMFRAIRNLSGIMMTQGHYAEARQYAEEMNALAHKDGQNWVGVRGDGDNWGVLAATMHLGYLTYLEGRFEEARKIYDGELSQRIRRGAPTFKVTYYTNLGEILHALG